MSWPPGHRCNAYCRPQEGEHTDLLYARAGGLLQAVLDLQQIYPIEVVGIEPAREAPAREIAPSDHVVHLDPDRSPPRAMTAWLVRWKPRVEKVGCHGALQNEGVP